MSFHQAAYNRVCLYLTSCVPYVPEPENTNLLKTALRIFRKFDQFPLAMRLALQLNDKELVEEIFLSCKDLMIQKQLAFMLGRHQVGYRKILESSCIFACCLLVSYLIILFSLLVLLGAS